jgi:hypothetical protein
VKNTFSQKIFSESIRAVDQNDEKDFNDIENMKREYRHSYAEAVIKKYIEIQNEDYVFSFDNPRVYKEAFKIKGLK